MRAVLEQNEGAGAMLLVKTRRKKDMNNILEIKEVTKYYGSGDNIIKALNGVSFTMADGEFVAIMGASGSGKSTLLNTIATIDEVSSGHILISGKDVAGLSEKERTLFRRNSLGFIFQDYNLLDTLTIGENIILPLNLMKRNPEESAKLLDEMASKLEIKSELNKFPKNLSGGQKQRAACARALITSPSLILADEPTGALDSNNSKALMKTFNMMNSELKSSILMVTHDAVMGSYASRILFLKDGEIWNELVRGNRDRVTMYNEIINTMAVLGGEADVR